MSPYGEPARRLRAVASADPYSAENTSEDWSTPTTLDFLGLFNPGNSNEPTQIGRESVVTQPEIYTAVGVDVRSGDRVEIRGHTYEVDGNPADWRFGAWDAGLLIKLQSVEG